MVKLGAKDLRTSTPSEADLAAIKRREIYIICDNVLDTYNIGSIFRLADAVAAKCVYLCGQTETPPNSRIAKAAVGTEKWVPWEYVPTAAAAVSDLKRKFSTRSNDKLQTHPRGEVKVTSGSHPGGVRPAKVVAIEQNPKAIDFRKAHYEEPVAFIVGNETEGVSRRILDMVDEIVEIPMFGVNRSLNVMVSLAVVLYRALDSLP